MPTLPDDSRICVKFKNGPNSSKANGFRNRHGLKDDPDDNLLKIGVRRFKLAPGLAKKFAEDNASDPDVDFIEADGAGYGSFTPNDPSYASQWHLPKINADDAWDDTAGDPSVVIAFIDTGAQYDHPDLAANLLRGPSYAGTTTSDDDHGHGTLTSGTAVAVFNNGLGVAGVAPKCRVYMVKGLNSSNWGYFSWWASAFIHIADKGYKIINISAGGDNGSSTLASAVTYAQNKGCLIVAARGNNANNVAQYPAAYSGVVAVSATASNNSLAGFSSYGSVTIAAPGVGIMTTSKGSTYAAPSGTSFSSPIVAGVAALVKSANSALTASEIKTILTDTATDLSNTTNFGAGLVDADAAVTAALAATPDTPPTVIAPSISFSSPASGETVSGNVQIQASVAGDDLSSLVFKVDGVTKATLPPNVGTTNFTWDSTGVSDGSRVLSLVLTQSGTNATSTATRTVSVLNATDSTAPVVTISSPSNGTTIGKKGVLKINASATDARGVTSMLLFINGVAVKTYTGVSSFSYSWKYFNAPNGSNTILVKARDAAANEGQASVSVTKTA